MITRDEFLRKGNSIKQESDTLKDNLYCCKEEVYTRTSFKHFDKIVTVFILDSEKGAYVNMLQRLIKEVRQKSGDNVKYALQPTLDIYVPTDDYDKYEFALKVLLNNYLNTDWEEV